MRLPNKYRDLAEQLASENESLRQEVNVERARRLSAEAISEERRTRAERSEEYAAKAEAARDAAVNARMQSVDLVNTTLLKALQPEQGPSVNIKDFKAVPKDKRQAVPSRRDADRRFTFSVLDHFKNPPTPKDAAANTQMNVLNETRQ